MKKSIVRMLTFALVMSGVGMVSSCKDYNDDLRTEFNSQIANLDVKLNDKIDQQIGNLNDKLKELEARLDAIKQCNCGVEKPWTADLATAIENALASVDEKLAGKTDATEVRQIVSEILNKELNGYYTKVEIDVMVSNIKSCDCDNDKLKSEIAGMIQNAITSTVTKEYIVNLIGKEFDDKAAIESLQKQIDAIAANACACGNLAEAVAQLKIDLAVAQQKHDGDIAELYKLYNDLNVTLIAVSSKADNAYELAQVAKDKAEEALKKGQEALSSIASLEGRVEILEKFKKTWEGTLEKWKSELPKMNEAIEDLKSTVDGLKDQIKNVEKTATEALEKAIEANDKADALDKRATIIENNYNELKEYVGDLAVQVYVNRDSIAILKDMCQANLEAAKAYTDQQITIAITSLETKITGDLKALEEKVKEADDKTNARIDSLNGVLSEHYGDEAAKFEQVNTDIASLEKTIHEKYNDLDHRIELLETWKVYEFVQWQDWVNCEILCLKNAVAYLMCRVSAMDTQLQDIEDRLSSVENTLKHLVTGININQVYNPVFGSFNFPSGKKSQVLVAFYGENEGDNVKFPSNSATNYLFDSEVFTDAEWELISGSVVSQNVKSGQKFLENRDDNAGTVYLTVNPNTVDFTGITLDMVNSQDESTPGMILSPLAKSDKVLDFGYTRAANNGFYEMAVKIEDPESVDKVSLQTERFQEIMADLKNIFVNFDLTRLTTTLYDQFHSMLPANALKAKWVDGDGEVHSVLSDYSIAATAVKPLSYKFLADQHFTSISAFDQVEKFIDNAATNVTKTLKKELSKIFNLTLPEAPALKEFALEGTDYENELAKFKIDADAVITIDGAKYTIDEKLNIVDANGGIVGTLPKGSEVEVKDGTMTVHVTMDVRDVLGTMYTDICSNVNDLVEALDKYCKDATKLAESLASLETSVDNVVGSVTTVLNEFLNSIEQKIVGALNLAISRLQPVMLMTANGRVMPMSRQSNYPSIINGNSIKLHPYSYNAEILNPAYLKHVAVVNVKRGSWKSAQDGDADCIDALKAVNVQENMNKAIPGSINEIEISGLKSGYVYQFAYTAMDYTGCIVTKRSYIYVK